MLMVKIMMMVKKEVREEIKTQRGSGTTAAMFLHRYKQSGVRRRHGEILMFGLLRTAKDEEDAE